MPVADLIMPTYKEYVEREQFIRCWCFCLTVPATPTLKQLKKALKSVSDWHSLGIYLDLKTHQLDAIEKNHHGDNERCRTEMLNAWLNSTTTPTWEAIVEALRQMEQGGVADNIQKKYNVIISTITVKGKVFTARLVGFNH